MQVTLTVRGLKELERKLGYRFLVGPEMEHVRDRLLERINRRRKTLGFQRNPLSLEARPLAADTSGIIAQVTTTLHLPRRTGGAWLRFVFSLVKGSFMRRQLAAAARGIEQRWGS